MQVQTEFSVYPQPRIITTVLNSGQVVHKIEKHLDNGVNSLEEQRRVERTMQGQHGEVVAIIKENPPPDPVDPPPVTPVATVMEPELATAGAAESPPKSVEELVERLRGLPGVEYVYPIDTDGNFIGAHTELHFKRSFSAIFKSLLDILDVFPYLPGQMVQRERGVYEVERNELYFISMGVECYFVTVRGAMIDVDYETVFKNLVDSLPASDTSEPSELSA